MHGLIETLLKQLDTEISVDCVCQVLTLADSNQNAALKSRCVDFIVAHMGELESSAAFAELSKPLLLEVRRAPRETSFSFECTGRFR